MKKSGIKETIRNICSGREGILISLLSCIVIVAITLAGVSGSNGKDDAASAGQLRSKLVHEEPWVVKSNGKSLVYVESEQAGDQVLLGLKIKYCDSLVSQQEAQAKNLVTVERAPARVYHRNEVLNASEAVDMIVGMNKVALNHGKAIENSAKKKDIAKVGSAANDIGGTTDTSNDDDTSNVDLTGSAETKNTKENAAENDAEKLGVGSVSDSDSEPPLTIALNKVVEEDQEIKYKTKVIKTDKLVRGKKEVKTKGECGSKHVISDIVMENGEYAGSTVLASKVTEKAVTKVVYEGTKLTTSDKGELLVQYATRFLGTKYVLGGADERKGIDCSGFTMRMYGKLGIVLPHYSYDQEHCGVDVKYEDAQPGDLILYPGHVGIYMGNNMMIHATPGEVKITDDCRYRKMTCVRRIFTDDDNVTQDMFDELFKDEYNEGAEAIAKEKLAKQNYYTMNNKTGNGTGNSSNGSGSAAGGTYNSSNTYNNGGNGTGANSGTESYRNE